MSKIIEVFAKALGISKEKVIDSLEYNAISEWDSIGHMSLVNDLETAFDIILEVDDIINMSSVAKVKEILKKYEVDV